MDSRTGVASALGVILILGPAALVGASPALGPALMWVTAAVAAIAAFVAAVRSQGLHRGAWLCMALSMTTNALGNLLFADSSSRWAITASLCYTASATLGVVAFGTLASARRSQLGTTLLHQALIVNSLWALLWMLDPQSLMSGRPRTDTTEELLTTIALVAGIVAATTAWLAVVPAYDGRDRRIMSLLGGAAIAAMMGDLLTYLVPTGDLWRLCQVLWVLQPVLVVAAAFLVALWPMEGLDTSLLSPRRDLVLVTILIAVVSALTLVTTHGELGQRLARSLCMGNLMLVTLHLHEGYHSRRLASSVEQQARHMRLLVSETRDIIIELDSGGHVLFASAALSTILGLHESDLTGQHISDVLPDVTPHVLDHLTYAPSARMQATLRLESALTTASATVVHVESVITPLASGYLVAVRDVTERVGLQSRLQQVTYHDVVTGLPNRTSLDRAVRHRLYESVSGEISLLLMDIAPAGLADNAIGDDSREELLRTVARTMRATARNGDSLARFSDLRFAVLLRQGTDPVQAVAEADRMVGALNRPDLVPDVTLRTCGGLCVGGHTGLELVRNAELALRQATREGPGTVQVFEPTMLAQFARTRHLRRRLSRPPAADRWTVLYQPIVNLRAEQVSGVEALLRWTDPEGDFIGIEEVIRLAEEFGSIIAIGTWVLEQSVAQALEWYLSGHPLTVAVNISVHQLVAPGFAATVHRVLDESGLPPELLILEITETVVLEQTDETIATLEELRELGIRVAIDDFGTGYSGLANLRSLPLDILKIDRTFVQGLGESGGDEAVVAAVSRLGRELGLTITAEGIETRAQEARARMLGISAAQGYLYARPLPASQIVPLADQLAGGGLALDL